MMLKEWVVHVLPNAFPVIEHLISHIRTDMLVCHSSIDPGGVEVLWVSAHVIAELGMDAVISLRSYADAWIHDHPNGKQTEFLKEMNNYMKPILLQANEDFMAEQKAKKDAEEKPTPQPQPKRSLMGRATDALGITTPPPPVPDLPPKREPLPKLSPKHVAELMTKQQRDEVTGMVTELRKGKDVKITERDLRDRLVPIFTDIYTKNGRDVLDALEGVDQFVNTLVKTKKPTDNFGDTAEERRTSEGRKIINLPDGSIETEKTATVTDKRINGGKATNIPTIYNGKHVSEEEAIEIIAKSGGIDPDTGRKLEGFNSIPEAVKAAKKRSAELGKKYANKK